MTNIVSNEKLKATRISIKGEDYNETFFVYGNFDFNALKVWFEENSSNGNYSRPTNGRKTRSHKEEREALPA